MAVTQKQVTIWKTTSGKTFSTQAEADTAEAQDELVEFLMNCDVYWRDPDVHSLAEILLQHFYLVRKPTEVAA